MLWYTFSKLIPHTNEDRSYGNQPTLAINVVMVNTWFTMVSHDLQIEIKIYS